MSPEVRKILMGNALRMRPRVLLCVDNFHRGGTQTQLVALANGLVASGKLDVYVACLKREGPLLEELELDPSRVLQYPLHRFDSVAGVRAAWRLARDVRERSIPLVHAFDFYGNVLCTMARVFTPSMKLVVSRRYLDLSDRRRHRWGELVAYKAAHRVVFNSEEVARELLDRGAVAARKIRVIPNGVLPGNGSQVARSLENPRLGIVASLVADKGHEVLLRAAAKTVARYPSLELVVVGGGPREGELRTLAGELGIGANTRFVGQAPNPRHWMRTFDVAVLSSHREGMPNAVLEYLAEGRPVVATAVGGVPEVLGNGLFGMLVSPGDPDGLADAVLRLLEDPALRSSLSERARKRAAEFGFEAMIRRTLDMYGELDGRFAAENFREGADNVRDLRQA